MKKILYFLIALGIIFPLVAFADALGSSLLDQSVGGIGLQKDVNVSIANIIAAVLAVTGTIFLILTVSAGIMWMTAAGNEDKITKAKKMITSSIVGLGVCLLAYTITYFVASNINVSASCSGQCISTQVECVNGAAQGDCGSGQHCCAL